MKLDDLRDQARSGIAPKEPEKPKRARKYVQEIDLRETSTCGKCASPHVRVTTDVDVLRDVQIRRVDCLECGADTIDTVYLRDLRT